MRTTIDIPDATYRRIKSKAAEQGTSVKKLILTAVERDLEIRARKGKRVKLPLLESKRPGALHLTNEQIYELIDFP